MDLNSFQIIDINLIAIIVLTIILFASSGFREKRMVQYKIFDMLVILGIVLNALEILGWIFDARVGADGDLARVLNIISNTLLYCFVPLPGAVWLLYTQHQIFHSVDLMRKTIFTMIPLLTLNAFISALSISTGWFFSVDQNNLYSRGPYFAIHVIIAYGFLAAAILLVLANRKYLTAHNFRALLLYGLPLVVGSALQVAFYGVNFNWPFMALSVLIIFVHIQIRGEYTDSLTGTYNRNHFERILDIRVNRFDADDRFALILADIDNLHELNQRLGWESGDEALQITADRLRQSLRKEDLIARVGDDEFYMLIELTDDKALAKTIERLYESFDQQPTQQDSRINVSICGKIYDRSSGKSAKTFLTELDSLIETEKQGRLKSS